MDPLFEIADVEFRQNEPLSLHSSVRIGGPADLVAFPRTEAALIALLTALRKRGTRHMVLGNASNTLFSDAGYRGVVIVTNRMKETVWDGTTIRAACGVSLTALAAEAANRGLSGLEFAYGIPGTVGGAVYMTAGAYGGQISDVLLRSVCLHDGEPLTREAAEHGFGYRQSVYRRTGDILLSATFALTESAPKTVRAACEKNMVARKEKQPLEFPSLGSVFKRPEGHFAGALIEDAGLKGTRIGGAEVSEKHAGFLINRGGATAADFLALVSHVQKVVQAKTGIFLEPEIILVPER